MPRLSATKAMTRPSVARPRARRPAPPPDRLSSRVLFFRRVRRSIKPGLWVLGILLCLAVVADVGRSIPKLTPVAQSVGGVRHGLAVLAGFAGFRVAHIEINGAEATPLPVIRAALGVKPGDPILGFSLDAVRAQLEQLGPVQSATVQRALPATLIVTVNERAAFAIWQDETGGAAKFVLIDKQGNVIADQDAAVAKRRQPSLLLLAGADAPQNAQTLLDELNAAPAVLAHVAAAERVDGLRWNLTLKNQTLVRLPAIGEQQAVARLAALQASMALLDRPVEVIDLRMPGRLIVRPYPATATQPASNAAGHT